MAVTEQQIWPGAQQLVPQQRESGEQAPAPGGGVHGGVPHCPPEQNGLSIGQVLSQEPQWCGSFSLFTQALLQQPKLEDPLHVVGLHDAVEPPVPGDPPEPLPPEPCAPPEEGEPPDDRAPPDEDDPPVSGEPPVPWAPPLVGEPPALGDPPEPFLPPAALAPPFGYPPVDDPPLEAFPPLLEPPFAPASCRDESLVNVVPPHPTKAAHRVVTAATAALFRSTMVKALL